MEINIKYRGVSRFLIPRGPTVTFPYFAYFFTECEIDIWQKSENAFFRRDDFAMVITEFTECGCDWDSQKWDTHKVGHALPNCAGNETCGTDQNSRP